MPPLSKLSKVLIGLGTATGAATYYYLSDPQRKAHAAWGIHYETSQCGKWNENWDYRSPKHVSRLSTSKDENNNQINEDVDLVKPKYIRHLILIRHGQYNTDGQNDDERTLTKLGQLQAEFTGKRLKELGLPYTTLIKSTMSRAQETGSIISNSLPEVPVTNCDMLREGAPIPPDPPIWKQEMHKFYVDGARIEAAFRKYFHRATPTQQQDTYTVLVCHANVIRYFVCRALQFPAEAWLRISLNHASITWISITPSGRVILRCLGDTGHMPPDVISSR